MRRHDDAGSAVVEFVWLTVLLIVPLVYLVLAGMSVQRAAFAETDAARDAARAYATAGSDAEGERRAEAAVAIALHDQGVAWTATGRVVQCGACEYAAGSEFEVDLQTKVALPFVPSWLCGQRCVAGISVSAHHRETLDCFGGGDGGAPC
jgi:Flp pilus assembly protein TadG